VKYIHAQVTAEEIDLLDLIAENERRQLPEQAGYMLAKALRLYADQHAEQLQVIRERRKP
jgi:hypothetical protein